MSKRPTDSHGEAPRFSKVRSDVSSTLTPLIQGMSRFLFQEQFADVHFNVGDPAKGPTARIPAHAVILCTASEVFNTQFDGNADRPKEVDVPDSDPETFRDFLRYIYTGEAVLDLDNVLGVLYLAKKYKIKELVREVEQFLAGILNRASVNYFLNYVDLIDNIENRNATADPSVAVKESEKENMLVGMLHNATKETYLSKERQDCKQLTWQFNPKNMDEKKALLKKIFDIERRLAGWNFAHPVDIAKNCWFGGLVSILPGNTIGDGCVIGAGSVVTMDVPANSFVDGVPAKVVKTLLNEADREAAKKSA